MANQKWLSGRVNGYTPGTLENNWNEERFDIKYLKDSKPLPSQYGHFYGTTYQELCSNQDKLNFAQDDAVKSAKHRTPGYPGHQSEMDPEYYKQRVNTYETEHRINYLDPRLKTFPFDLKQMMTDELNSRENTSTNLLTYDFPKSNAPPAPIVQLERVFSSEPEKRIYKTATVVKTEEPPKQEPVAQQQQQQQNMSFNGKPKEEEESKDGEELSNFEKLMIRLNKKKGKIAESQNEKPIETQKQFQQSQPQEAPEQPISVAKETIQREKTAKTVRWQDQNVDS